MIKNLSKNHNTTMKSTYIKGGSRGGGRGPKIGKNKIFWRKIVIFHTKYPKNPGSAPVYILLKVLIIVDSKEEGK